MEAFLNWLSNNPVVTTFLVTAFVVFVGVVVLLYFIAFLQGREISFWPPKIGPKLPDINKSTAPHSNQNNTIANIDSAEFSTLFVRILQDAKKVVMIGTGLKILHTDFILKLLMERVEKGSHVEVYAANPYSPNVEVRLIEEETSGSPLLGGSKSLIALIGKAGLVRWLNRLVTNKESLGNKSNFSLRLFPFYPTYALFIFDDHDYFFYPYGYIQLGTFSPVTHYTEGIPDHEKMIRFLSEQYEIIKERSADAELILNIHNEEIHNEKAQIPEVKRSQLTAFAVYLVPSTKLALYKFGSEVLGYDVRAKCKLQPIHQWPEAIGAASDYGIHVTIADVLYCAHKRDIDLICEEVKCVASSFSPFTLKLNLAKNFPDEKGIALVCEDKSGSLEALHHEMVSRVYRKAVASNYNFDSKLANRDTDEERANLMIKHYHAPYILQRFKPHFSLLSAVPAEQKDQIYDELKSLYKECKGELSIEIYKIAVMEELPDSGGHWRIRNEYSLGGEQQ